VKLTVREDACGGGGGGVAISAAVRCAAGVPWVMQNTVEGIMLDQARSTLEGFIDFCHVSAAPGASRSQWHSASAPRPGATGLRPAACRAACSAASISCSDRLRTAARRRRRAHLPC
jgi:hypothetical protein